MKTRDEITRMKCDLYAALLEWPHSLLTQDDANLLATFCESSDVQAILERARKEEGGK